MEKGTLIDYTIKLAGIPLRWRSLITEYDPPIKFVDEQLNGPYSYWHHTHSFRAVNSGVEMNDVVRYAIPMGIIGRFMHAIWIKRDLNKIFNHRKQVIDNLLAAENK